MKRSLRSARPAGREIETAVERVEQLGNGVRIVLAVGVHQHDVAAAHEIETGLQRVGLPGVATEVDPPQLGEARAVLLEHLDAVVGAAVVDHHDLERQPGRAEGGDDLLEHLGQVGCLVVGREKDRDVRLHREKGYRDGPSARDYPSGARFVDDVLGPGQGGRVELRPERVVLGARTASVRAVALGDDPRADEGELQLRLARRERDAGAPTPRCRRRGALSSVKSGPRTWMPSPAGSRRRPSTPAIVSGAPVVLSNSIDAVGVTAQRIWPPHSAGSGNEKPVQSICSSSTICFERSTPAGADLAIEA